MTVQEPGAPTPLAGRLVSDADHVQLTRLVTELAWLVDNRRSSAFGELVTEDAVMDIGGDEPLRGRAAIADWGLRMETPPWNSIHHAVANARFVEDGPDAAIGSTLLIVFVDTDGTRPSVPMFVGEDHDRFVRTDQGWRLASRSWTELYSRGGSIDAR